MKHMNRAEVIDALANLDDDSLGTIIRLRVNLALDGAMVLTLISTIQAACQHPEFNGPARQRVEELARRLQKILGQTPRLQSILQSGFGVT